MRTEQEIMNAIQRLKENKIKCERYNFFGEDNHHTIDIIIYILKEYIKDAQLDIGSFKYNLNYNGLELIAIDIFAYINKKIRLDDLLYPEKKISGNSFAYIIPEHE